MHITLKKNFERKNYKFCGKNMKKVEHHLYLGVELVDDLKWNQHIRNISGETNRMLGLLRWNLYHCREKVKETAYIALVRPKLEYCALVRDPSVQISIDKLEMVQRRAAMICTRCLQTRFRCGNRATVLTPVAISHRTTCSCQTVVDVQDCA